MPFILQHQNSLRGEQMMINTAIETDKMEVYEIEDVNAFFEELDTSVNQKEDELSRIKHNIQKSLKKKNIDKVIEYRFHGIQEDNQELRKKNKEFIEKNILDICQPLIGYRPIDPDGFLFSLFKYIASWCYQNGMKVPFDHDDLVRFGEPLFELCPMGDVVSEDSMNKQFELESAYYLFDRINVEYGYNKQDFRDHYHELVKDIKEEQEEHKKIVKSFFRGIDYFESSDSLLPVGFWIEGHLFYFHLESTKHTFAYKKCGRGYSFYHVDPNEKIETKVKPKEYIHRFLNQLPKLSAFAVEIKELFQKEKMNIRVQSYTGKDEPYHLIQYKDISIRIEEKNGHFVRVTGEEVLNFNVLIQECLEMQSYVDKNKENANQVARNLFMNLLDDKELKEFEEKNAIWVEGIDHDYLIAPEIPYNSVLEFPKGSKNLEEAHALCIVAKENNIPRMDVMTSVKLMIQAGQEKLFHTLANRFKPNRFHEDIMNNFVLQ